MEQRGSALRRAAGVLAIGCAAVLGATGLAPASSGASSVDKSVVTFAELPGSSPNYIFPFFTTAYFSVANTSYFQRYMYRPLYWSGDRGSIGLNKALSLAKTPVFSDGDRTVTVTLKPYKWSNGAAVDATDVLFFLNIWKQKPTAYGAWFPGGLSMPTSITGVKITSPSTFTISLDRSFNPRWLLTNELALITPLPLAWTKSSTPSPAGSAGCATAAYGTADSACKAVYDYLSEQSGFNPTNPKTTINALPTYATNPLWKVVDGPWTLTSFAPTSDVVFEPNPSYSGPNKPKIKKYIEKPYTSTASEFSALVAGTIDVGYLPETDVITPATKPATPGHAPVMGKNNPRLTTFTLAPLTPWGINYFPENFKSTGDTGNAGAIFDQLYVRQAIQRLVNQTLYVNRIFRGYAVPDYGPVPPLPKSAELSKDEEHNPYPYDPSAAKALLSSHGWKVVPNGTSVCQKPGTASDECGKGIPRGAKLAFTLLYASGTKAFTTLMSAEKSSWAKAGIHITLTGASFDTVIGVADPCPNGCPWEMGNWLAGWTFTTGDATGEELFSSGAADNSGLYTTSTATRLITATVVSNAKLTRYENYLAKMLPVVWQPREITLVEVHKGLAGAIPTSPLYQLTPATFHWT